MYSSGRFLLALFLAILPFSLISYERLQGRMNRQLFFNSLESYQWKIRLLDADKIYFSLVWLMSPVILPFIISLFSQPIYITRCTIVASLAFILSVSRAINNVQIMGIRWTAIIIVILLSLVSIGRYYAETEKEQWRGVAEYIDAHANNGDIVLLSPSFCVQPLDYYDRNARLVKKGFPEDKRKDIDETDIPKLLETSPITTEFGWYY
jgi:hypothetical protein